MTHSALSLALLSHPTAKYHPRRKERVSGGASWARQHGYQYDRTVTVGAIPASSAPPELFVLAALQEQLQAGTIAQGTVLILDDFGSLSEPRMRSALAQIMSLVMHGMPVLTLRDGKIWDATSMSDIGGFMMSVILDYAGNLRGQYMSARVRAALERKKHRAEKEAA